MTGVFDRLKSDAAAEWRAYIEHPFVAGLGDGTLPQAAFRHFLVQDYLFLTQFARAYALAAFKAQTLDEMRHASFALATILDVEMDLHVRFSERWGLTRSDLEQAGEARATIAYTRFVLDAGQRGDLLDLMTALAPCIVGYAEIGLALEATPAGRAEGNPYREWIAEYAERGLSGPRRRRQGGTRSPRRRRHDAGTLPAPARALPAGDPPRGGFLADGTDGGGLATCRPVPILRRADGAPD